MGCQKRTCWVGLFIHPLDQIIPSSPTFSASSVFFILLNSISKSLMHASASSFLPSICSKLAEICMQSGSLEAKHIAKSFKAHVIVDFSSLFDFFNSFMASIVGFSGCVPHPQMQERPMFDKYSLQKRTTNLNPCSKDQNVFFFR